MGRIVSTLLSTLALATALAACAPDPPAEEALPPGDASAASPDTTRMYMVRLDGQRRPDVVGSAGFVPRGERTLVVAGIRGLASGATLQGGIHQGESCDSPGAAALSLEEIRIGGDATGRSTTTVDADIGTIFDGGHLVVFRSGGTGEEVAVVCGDIPVLVPLVEETPPAGGA